MATPERLMGVGVEAETAKRVGFFLMPLGSNSVNGPGNFLVPATAALSLGSNFDLGDVVKVVAAVTGTTCTVSPGTNAKIGIQATASSGIVVAGYMRELVYAGFGQWYATTSA